MSFMRIIQSILFITVALSIYLGMHWFCYWRVVQALNLSEQTRLYIKLALAVLAITFVAGEFLARLAGFDWLLMVGYVWLGTLSIALAVLFLIWLPLLLRPQWAAGATTAGLALIVLLSGYSLFNGMSAPRVRHIALTLPHLPGSLSGFKLVQISDLHLGDTATPSYLQGIADTIRTLQPDAVVMTGDLIDGPFRDLQAYIAPLRAIQARHGVFAVTGNHEFYAGVGHFDQIVAAAGWTNLRNRHVAIADGLVVAGVDDDAGLRAGDRQTRATVLSALAPQQANILLYHRPFNFQDAVRHGVSLQLSGHSHAGQIPPMDFLVWLTYHFPFGLYQRDGAYIYTTCGTGTWGPPMRLFSRNEIVCFTLLAPAN
jgi:uncharacterized protein